MAREIVNTCGICGDLVRSRVAAHWQPRKQARRAQLDMQEHLMTHTFAELLRHEIRRDLDQVPAEQLPSIVRDIYHSLLGKTNGTEFTLDPPDRLGLYSIEEALGDVSTYRLWRSANSCGDRSCQQHDT